MSNSENKPEKAIANESNRMPPSSSARDENNLDTSMPQQSQNSGSQKISSSTNGPESILSLSNNVLPQQYQHRPSNPKRNELPADTRPERIQRPEDLKRSQYLSTTSEIDMLETDDNVQIKKNIRKPPTCWVTASWILTWWAPPFILRTFGK